MKYWLLALLVFTSALAEPNNCIVGQLICDPLDPATCKEYGRVWAPGPDAECIWNPLNQTDIVEMRVYLYYTATNHGPWVPWPTCPLPPPDQLCTSIDQLVWEPHDPIYLNCTWRADLARWNCPIKHYRYPFLRVFDYPMILPGREYNFAERVWYRRTDGTEVWTPGHTIFYDPWRDPELQCQVPPYTNPYGSNLCWPEYMECPLGAQSNLDCTIHLSE